MTSYCNLLTAKDHLLSKLDFLAFLVSVFGTAQASLEGKSHMWSEKRNSISLACEWEKGGRKLCVRSNTPTFTEDTSFEPLAIHFEAGPKILIHDLHTSIYFKPLFQTYLTSCHQFNNVAELCSPGKWQEWEVGFAYPLGQILRRILGKARHGWVPPSRHAWVWQSLPWTLCISLFTDAILLIWFRAPVKLLGLCMGLENQKCRFRLMQIFII